MYSAGTRFASHTVQTFAFGTLLAVPTKLLLINKSAPFVLTKLLFVNPDNVRSLNTGEDEDVPSTIEPPEETIIQLLFNAVPEFVPPLLIPKTPVTSD